MGFCLGGCRWREMNSDECVHPWSAVERSTEIANTAPDSLADARAGREIVTVKIVTVCTVCESVIDLYEQRFWNLGCPQ